MQPATTRHCLGWAWAWTRDPHTTLEIRCGTPQNVHKAPVLLALAEERKLGRRAQYLRLQLCACVVENGKGGRQRRAAARATGLAGRDEQTVAALAPRLAPRCSAPFCSRWETFCSVSCNGPNYSEPRSVGTCWQEVTPPCCQPSSHRGCGSRAASGLVRAGRPSGTTGAAATAAQRTRAALHLFRARRLCSLTGLRA
ncbi:uncharacterized protein LOC126635764 isoform X4 [Myiozetetes cayanensis]|uniref:uncharacterized protein LOC126635764 isoform X4 n=1 Tax=Myiozetetes cayanensis TaxID=478635 RepID=UPI00216023AE|nr:uncharacterized protein LOC126635764 isoform X4 [Myiozetetes cayanensis]XP_050163242.1 uncharacterized protein LOC126635764 isoform X4 [Myiozetetes cayanensis]XP_050163243.1 uncharacterized protein LOC126635764 isoform X4 [Myiozetetes cayanensis]